MNRLIAFDFGGTLALDMHPIYPDMAKVLHEAVEENPGLQFGVASNGSLIRITNFLVENKVTPLFKNESGELLVAGSFMDVTIEDIVEIAVPSNWREKLTGRYTGKGNRKDIKTVTLSEKPSGDQLRFLMSKAGIEHKSATVYIGDVKIDSDEACSAGVSFIKVDGLQIKRSSMRPLIQTAVEEVTSAY